MQDVIIVGAGCAGLTAALYAARAGKSVLIFESENIGGQITAAPVVENYPGIPRISGMEFADRLYEQVTALGVQLKLETVLRIESNGGVKDVTTDEGQYQCKTLIIATGAKHRPLGLPREEALTGHGVSYCALCDGIFFKGKPVAIVGGGNTAITDAIFLSAHCESVTIIHRRDEFRAEKSLIREAQSIQNIHWVVHSVVEELVGSDRLSGIRLRNKVSGELNELHVDGLFVAIGQIPANAGFRHLLHLDDEGYIIAGEDCTTDVQGIYVAGDCRAKVVHQLTTAAADGAIAAMAAWKCCSLPEQTVMES